MDIFRKLVTGTAMGRFALGAFVGGVILGHCIVAGAVDLAAIAQLREREQATAQVDAARLAVATARDQTAVARKRLDDFLAKHFELRGKAVESSPALELPSADSNSQPAHDPEADRLSAQLRELRAERERLLGTLTEAHPEVVDVDGRIAAVGSKLQSLPGPTASELPNPTDLQAVPAPSVTAEVLRQSQADAEEFRRLFADWQACEHELEAARGAEINAIERLAALAVVVPPASKPARAASDPQQSSRSIIEEVTKPASVAAGPPIAAPAISPPASSNTSSQSLALAALTIALAIAALAAVKLSRSGSDPLFANADDVAAALAVPVVGIVPASIAGDRIWASADLRRFAIVTMQMLGAVVVFATIAYLVQHVEDVVRFCASPVTSIRGFFGI